MTNTDNLTIGQAEIYFREGIDSPLVGYWSFDEGSGTTAIDRSGNGNNGTLSSETGTVTDESFTSVYDTAVQLNHANLDSGSVVVTTTDGLTTYTENTDYTIGYTAGTITVLSTGTMADATEYYIDYTYNVWATGISEYCLDFDGVGNYVDCGTDSSLVITGDITLSAWVYPINTPSGYAAIICTRVTNALHLVYAMDIDQSDRLRFNYYNGTSFGDWATTETVPHNTWTHIAVVHDVTNSKVRFFIDGSLKLEVNDVGAPTSLFDSLRLGVDPMYSGAPHFPGSIDEIRIYNRALSTTEIQALYSNPNGKLISASMPDTQSLGNIVTSGINVDTTYAEHYKKVKGKRVKDEEFVITNGININFTFDEIKRENIQKFLLGKEADTSASRIKVMLENGIRGRAILKFNTDVGNSLLYAIPKCVLKSDGGLNLTSDKWVEGNFKIDVLYHDTYRIGDDTSASKAPFGYVDVDATIFGSPF